MPMIHLTVTDPKKNAPVVLAEASRIVAAATGKPESYVMAFLDGAEFLMRGKAVPSAFVEVRGIGGISKTVNAEISKNICALLQKQQGIPAENVYLNFIDVPGQNWGTCNGTF